MIRSMTGFGDASRQAQGVTYTLELRSLNNRYFKLLTRLPDAVTSLEGELEQRLKKHVHRGSFSLIVKLKTDAEHAVSQVNDAALAEYLRHLQALRGKLGGDDAGTTVDLTALLSLPGVLQPAESEDTLLTRAKPVLLELVDEAAAKLNRMRDAEGRSLADDLRTHLDVLAARVATIAERRPVVLSEYEDRLRTRVQELIRKSELTVDKVDLLREVAIYADRSDVAEELSRTTGHLEQFRQTLSRETGEPDGRTLDFIAQELLREANTIASKSQDAAVARAAVEMKSAIDRIKEQVQNVE